MTAEAYAILILNEEAMEWRVEMAGQRLGFIRRTEDGFLPHLGTLVMEPLAQAASLGEAVDAIVAARG